MREVFIQSVNQSVSQSVSQSYYVLERTPLRSSPSVIFLFFSFFEEKWNKHRQQTREFLVSLLATTATTTITTVLCLLCFSICGRRSPTGAQTKWWILFSSARSWKRSPHPNLRGTSSLNGAAAPRFTSGRSHGERTCVRVLWLTDLRPLGSISFAYTQDFSLFFWRACFTLVCMRVYAEAHFRDGREREVGKKGEWQREREAVSILGSLSYVQIPPCDFTFCSFWAFGFSPYLFYLCPP